MEYHRAFSEAMEWYLGSADQGNADDWMNIGYLFSNGQGVARVEGQAMVWYRKAADEGNATVQHRMLDVREWRRCCKRLSKATEYSKAVEGGYLEAKSKIDT